MRKNSLQSAMLLSTEIQFVQTKSVSESVKWFRYMALNLVLPSECDMTLQMFGDISTKGVHPQCTNAILQQDELHDVADLLEVDLSDDHVDGVGGDEDEGEEGKANGVTSERDLTTRTTLATWGRVATAPEIWKFSGQMGVE